MANFDPQTGAPVVQYATPGPQVPPVSGGAQTAGVFALIASILGLLVPFHGWAYITPVSIIVSIVALNGGAKGLGITAVVINFLNLAISPTDPLSVWAIYLKVYANKTYAMASWVFILAAINWIGVIYTFFLIPKKRRT